ncbi:MAG: malonic semialdehyde reductase [Actinobacteria bacterium]|nr:malonic semialdehyde reductase [Actinomycetota bacterium]
MRIDRQAEEQLFTAARTAKSFSDEPVSDAQLRAIAELVRWPPTMANSQPLRVAFIRSPRARERLIPLLTAPNRPKTASAPVAAILAVDLEFHEHIPRLYPHGAHLRDRFCADAAGGERAATFSGAMQAGYFILAARAVGLAAGPMLGFDQVAVDAEFFPDRPWKSILVVNLGRPGERPWRERLPRLDHDEFVEHH